MSEAEQSNGFERVAQVPAKAGNALGRVLGSVLDAGRDILARRGMGAESEYNHSTLLDACRELLDHRGEASGLECIIRVFSRKLPIELLVSSYAKTG